MLREILANVNGIDVVMGCIILRSLFIGYFTGFVVELFKIVGMLLATFVTLHYYTEATGLLEQKFIASSAFNQPIAFILLWFLVVLVLKFIRDGVLLLMKVEAHSVLDRWSGVFLAAGRAALICGLFFSLIVVSGNKPLIKSAKKAFLGFYLLDISPQVYNGIFDGLVIKFFPEEQKNERVQALLMKEVTPASEQ